MSYPFQQVMLKQMENDKQKMNLDKKFHTLCKNISPSFMIDLHMKHESIIKHFEKHVKVNFGYVS